MIRRKMLQVGMRVTCVSLLVLAMIALSGCNRSVTDAARKGDLKAVKFLFAHGTKSIHYSRHLALGSAAASGQAEIVRFVLEDSNNDPNRKLALTSIQRAFILASQNGQTHIIKILLENDAEVNLCGMGENGKTPLYMAAVNGQKEAVKTLLENGADVNGRNKMGQTALLGASLSNRTEMANILLSNGADINDKNKGRGTALHIAISVDHLEMVKYLLSKKADINVQVGLGVRPLHIAAWCDRIEIAKLLLEHGADPTLTDNGHAALEIATSEEFRKLLQQYGVD